jgi:hypothetical protein
MSAFRRKADIEHSAFNSGAPPPSRRCWRAIQQVGCFDAQHTCQAIDDIDPGSILASFEGADVGAIDTSLVR